MREIKEGLNKWREILCSRIGRLDVVKMSVLSKFIYRFNTNPIKLPVDLFLCVCEYMGNYKLFLKFR